MATVTSLKIVYYSIEISCHMSDKGSVIYNTRLLKLLIKSVGSNKIGILSLAQFGGIANENHRDDELSSRICPCIYGW